MKDIIRVAAAVPRVRPGNVDFNLSETIKYIRRAKDEGVKLLVLPELGITGYSCGDMFFSDILTEAALAALISLEREADGISFAAGAPLKVGGQLCNCAFFYANRRIVGVVPKIFLPNNAEFTEKRWFKPGYEAGVDFVNIGGRDIPFGEGLIFVGEDGNSVGIELCEDFWTPIPPATYLSMGGANIILNLSASPSAAGKREYRRSLVVSQSARLMVLYVYASSGSGEAVSDAVFSGHSIIASGGVCLAENKNYVDSDYLLVTDSDLGCTRADRMKTNRFRDSVYYNRVFEKVRRIAPSGLRFTDENPPADLLKISRHPFVPSDPAALSERVSQLFEMQSAALARRLELTRCRPVIGISGGLDSTLALLVTLGALDRLGRPSSDALGITMPSFGTSEATYKNALELMESLGVESRVVNITESVGLHFSDIGQPEGVFDVTYENAQARERTQVLMDTANMVGGLVVGTGDLSELALGWSTYNGDHMSMYGVNASLPKTLIVHMVRILAQTERFAPARDALLRVVSLPISPELLPPDAASGKIAQKTEDIVGPYELHDFFLFYLLRFGFSPKKIYELASLAFVGYFSPEEIKKWLLIFHRRFFSSQFKRSCSPDSPMLGSVFLSPRGGWNVPSDAEGALWIKEIERL